MEFWFVFLVSISISALLKSLFDLFKSPKTSRPNFKLPPGPPSLPLIGNPLWLFRSISSIESILRSLHSKYGPVVSLRFGSSPPSIFVSSHSLAHRALIQHGATFADRPSPTPTARIVNSHQHNINSAPYGPNWRLLRRNLTSQILHPSRTLPSFSPVRRRVLNLLVDRIDPKSNDDSSSSSVLLVDHFRYAMFCLLVFMCFGEDESIDDAKINDIKRVMMRLLLRLNRFRILSFWPRLGKLVFRNRWKEFMDLVDDRIQVLAPLIRNRIRVSNKNTNNDNHLLCYVDTLLDLQLPEEKRNLTEGEMVSLCSEFLTAGTDTTTTALQWIMANLVKHPNIQQSLFAEISEVLNLGGGGGGEEEPEKMTTYNDKVVEEGDLQKMPYLKAVILEGLRRHPPGHFVVPHAVTEEVELGGYVMPKDATVNFMVAEMGWDPKVWEDPMAFKPERFVADNDEEGFDITGSREIKMMPFGVGRRICPGLGVAMLHLEYFVANLVWRFEWKAVDGEDDVDLSEKDEFTVVMKNPLRAKLRPRFPPKTNS